MLGTAPECVYLNWSPADLSLPLSDPDMETEKKFLSAELTKVGHEVGVKVSAVLFPLCRVS